MTSALVVKEGVEGGPSSLTTVPGTVYVSDKRASSQGGGGGRTLLSHHSTRYSIQMGGELKVCVKMMTSSLVVKEGAEGGPSSLTTVPGTVYRWAGS